MITEVVTACVLTYSTVGLSPLWERAVDRAVDIWAAAGVTISEVTDSPDVTIRIGEADPNRWASGSRIDWWAGYYDITMKTIVLNGGRTYRPGVRPRLVAHELGHALGYDHDNDPAALMHSNPGTEAPPRCMI